MSLKAIVTDGRGAMIRTNKGIVTYSTECWKKWETGEVYLRSLSLSGKGWDENGNLYVRKRKTIKLYVNSVSGATVESESGDGTRENPFRCLNSALQILDDYSKSGYPVDYISAFVTGCFCEDLPVLQIILTGKVDYSINHSMHGYYYPYIEGDGNTEFDVQTAVSIMRVGYYGVAATIKNCTVKIRKYEAEIGDLLYDTVLENCKIYAPAGLGSWWGGWWGSGRSDSPSLLYKCEFYVTQDVEYTDRYIYLGYLYESSLHINDNRENCCFCVSGFNSCNHIYQSSKHSDILFGELLNSNLQGDVRWDGEKIISSTINTNSTEQEQNNIVKEQIKNSSITVSTTGRIAFEIPYARSIVCENSNIHFTADLSEYQNSSWYGYALGNLYDSAFRGVNVTGTLHPSTSGHEHYCYQLCWCASVGSRFVRESGSAFSRIAYYNTASSLRDCPVEPY